MIFVTLGTQDKQFERLLEAVEKLETDERIIAQIGSTEFQSNKMEIHKYLTSEEFNNYMEEANIIITHAGVATIMQGLKMQKKMIVAARLKEYKEHVNNHQLQILETFSKDGYIMKLENFKDLPELIKQDFRPKQFISNNKEFVINLDKEIDRLTKE